VEHPPFPEHPVVEIALGDAPANRGATVRPFGAFHILATGSLKKTGFLILVHGKKVRLNCYPAFFLE
jgi:hypothetical protein